MAHCPVLVRLYLPTGRRDPNTCCRVDRQLLCRVQRNQSWCEHHNLRQIPASSIHQTQTILSSVPELTLSKGVMSINFNDEQKRNEQEAWLQGLTIPLTRNGGSLMNGPNPKRGDMSITESFKYKRIPS
ncbi:hypothetical protein CRENBAI_006229, partial [Crenichthys baileyi]